jgi:hypothetical protein
MIPTMKPTRGQPKLSTGSSNNVLHPTRPSTTRIGALNMLSAMRSPAPLDKNPLKRSSSAQNLSQLKSTVTATATAGALARVKRTQASSTSAVESPGQASLASLVVRFTASSHLYTILTLLPLCSISPVLSSYPYILHLLQTSSVDFEERLHDIVAAEVESAIAVAVRNAMEKEMVSVEEAVSNALKADRNSMDLRANVNTLVAVIGIVIFERGVWTAWDVCFGDSAWSEVVSVGIGLGILTAIRVFNIPLAEWRKP